MTRLGFWAFAAAALCLAFGGGAADAGDDDPLRADDECVAEDGSDGECALSAAQLRAAKLAAGPSEADAGASATSNVAIKATASVDAGAEIKDVDLDEGNASSAASAQTWPFSSSGIKYSASCFGNAGADSCKQLATMKEGRCMCIDGCMGADGSCYTKQTNKVVAKSFAIKNLKWPTYKMYVQRMSVFGQMKTTSFSSSYNMGQDLFTLYELPGEFEGKKEYFLASSKWPDYVVAIKATGGTAFSLWGAYSVSLESEHAPWSLREIMLRICSARKFGHPDAIMIGTSQPHGGSTIYAYIHSGSYLVYGYWYPERLIESKILPSSLSGKEKNASSPASTPGEG
eukprot:CAMPEP_0115242626 /NCGR_PEP_ID=MMETSP0270-20121206/39051_1 /TAXON_ID=71861 /ORGANISM="Scrippsiella trochoidea, Strain CCMP3099" /LENGTH=342 /DNA_ID=CAMNT_0002657701 /DNA_START=50 /DNA_END=1075 /DNA_ORIENTATION=+